MACPGGCSGGGGQPIDMAHDLAQVRGQSLYGLDKNSALRFSHENPSISALYERFKSSNMLERVHKLLHTDHNAWDMPPAPELWKKEPK
jgi:NADH-quinone oxidoreductase subunit G